MKRNLVVTYTYVNVYVEQKLSTVLLNCYISTGQDNLVATVKQIPSTLKNTILGKVCEIAVITLQELAMLTMEQKELLYVLGGRKISFTS